MKASESAPASRSKGEEEEVVMGTNEAYETVKVRYQRSASVLQGNTREEPVYELPTMS